MVSPYKITYNGVSSIEMDCLTCLSFDSDSGSTETHLAREAVIAESYNGANNKVYGYKWNESFTFSITFMKNDFGNFTDAENRKMLKWLTGNPSASFIDVYKDDSNAIAWSALGNWVNVSSYKLGNGRIVGYVAEWESIHPFAFSHLKTEIKELNESTITLEVETDDPKNPIYPRITIEQDGSSDVSITNTHTDILNKVTHFNTSVKNNIAGEIIVLDGANRVVSSSRPNGRIFGEDFDWQWIPLYEGKNAITVTGNCVVKFEYREPYKVGEF